MKKRRSLSKPEPKSKKKKVAIKRVKLPATGIVRVEVPSGIVPAVSITDKAIEIVPTKDPTWWEYLFGKQS